MSHHMNLARSMEGEEGVVHLLLAVLALGLSAALRVSSPEGSIEDFIVSEMPASGVPGLAYAVVADDEITSVGAHGVVRLGGDGEVTPDTAFLTGSISKSFTALAVMQLVEAGKIDLDTEVSSWLDRFSARPAGAVTIRQLLSHTSGFSTLQGNASPTDINGGEDELARRVDQLVDVTPADAPNEKWEYSNTNYLILGRVVEVVSGQQYQPMSGRTSSNRSAWITASSPTARSTQPWRPGTDRGSAPSDRWPCTRPVAERRRRVASWRAPTIWRATCR